MEYTILSTEVKGDTTFTEVQYIIEGQIVIVNIAHFIPQTQDDIILGIQNRFITESRKINPDLYPEQTNNEDGI